MREAIRSGFKFADGGAVERGPLVPQHSLPVYRQSAPPQNSGGGGVSFSPTFHNYNTDAVRSTREQVSQFSQKIDSMAVPLA